MIFQGKRTNEKSTPRNKQTKKRKKSTGSTVARKKKLDIF